MKRALLISLVALICLGGFVLLDLFQPFAYLRLRNLYQDALARAGRTAPKDPNLVSSRLIPIRSAWRNPPISSSSTDFGTPAPRKPMRCN
jgi:hypothetical protein